MSGFGSEEQFPISHLHGSLRELFSEAGSTWKLPRKKAQFHSWPEMTKTPMCGTLLQAGDYIRITIGVIKGDTRSLDYTWPL